MARRLHRSQPLGVAALQLRAARERAGARAPKYRGGPTAVIAHGANPGLVSHFVKQALLNLARDTGVDAGGADHARRLGPSWPRDLGVKVIHIAERDTQVSPSRQAGRASSSTPGRSTASSRRGQPAGRDGLGHPREGAAGRRRAPRVRLRRGDLPATGPGAAHARAHLDAAGGAVPRLHHHPQRVDLDRRLLHACARATRSSTGRPCTTPIIPATRRSCRCTSSPARTCTSRSASA